MTAMAGDDELYEDGEEGDLADLCDHDEYELDIITGRACCGMCGHRWHATAEEMKRHEELSRLSYPEDEPEPITNPASVEG